MEKTLDQKLARIRQNPSCREFILADAKDADMAYGLAAPGLSPEPGFAERMAALAAAALAEPGTRLPGTSRLDRRAAARRHGLQIPAALEQEIEALRDSGA